MKNKNSLKIAGELTVGDWTDIRDDLSNGENWEKGIKFVEKRISYRFIEPIKLILKNDTGSGEGFTAMSISCLLLETLQAFRDGASFNSETESYFLPNGDEEKSSGLVTKFLETQSPFKDQISNNRKKKFYSHVRCGLLHEGGTKKNWVIRKSHKNDDFKIYEFEEYEKNHVIYRTAFFEALQDYFKRYLEELIQKKSKKLRKNYITKFDEIC